jgi:hypothetical protein
VSSTARLAASPLIPGRPVPPWPKDREPQATCSFYDGGAWRRDEYVPPCKAVPSHRITAWLWSQWISESEDWWDDGMTWAWLWASGRPPHAQWRDRCAEHVTAELRYFAGNGHVHSVVVSDLPVQLSIFDAL